MVQQATAEKSGFRFENVSLDSGVTPKQWRCPQTLASLPVERAVLSHYQMQGWRGFWGEGGLVLSLIKTMSFTSLDHDQRIRLIEALYQIAKERERYACPFTIDDLLRTLRSATVDQVRRNFEHMNSRGPFTHSEGAWSSTSTRSLQDQFPGLELWMLTELLSVAGVDLIHGIATIFATDPYQYRSGWPDITMWRGGQLRFVEVKAPGDSLGSSQKKVAQDIAGPLKLDFWLANVSVN